MGYLDSLKSLFTASASGQEQDTHWIYVRCQRCGESIKTRLDLRNNLTPRDEANSVAWLSKRLFEANLLQLKSLKPLHHLPIISSGGTFS
jgi:hypothetical protein